MFKIFYRITNLNNLIRRTLLIIFDLIILLTTFLISDKLTSNSNFLTINNHLIASLFIIIIFYLTNHYHSLTRYSGSYFLYRSTLRNLLSISALFVFYFFTGKLLGFEFLLISFLLMSLLIAFSRYLIRDLLYNHLVKKRQYSNKIIIYGAGEAGAQLAASIDLSGDKYIKAFVDDDSSLWGRYLNGKKIISPKILKNFKNEIDQVLIAIPSISNKRRIEIIKFIQKLDLPVMQLPSLHQLTSRKITKNSLLPINIEDLLERNVRNTHKKINLKAIDNLNILVTGAAGSIGREICFQLLKHNPSKIVGLDLSEKDIYFLEEEISKYNTNLVKVKLVLGNACHKNFIFKLVQKEKIDVIFHAAAYKHVPIVESNPLPGMYNNILSTKVLCKVASELKLRNFILISTDKAVRPKNIMGASKRVAEIIVQKFSQEKKSFTKFSMVRFGNVLGSSGSVIPLFKKQIESGGPITLTHPNVKRYFMTISEAAQLVITSADLAKGGDLFVLDMGEPVLVKDLAHNMIKLSGLTVKNESNPNGDIEVVVTGLRPGEKLYEELLLDGDFESTENKLIFCAKETLDLPQDFWDHFSELEQSLITQNEKEALNKLSFFVKEWENYKKY